MQETDESIDAETEDEPGPPGWPDWIEHFILPIGREHGLGVVWLILLLHVVMAMSVSEIVAIRDRNPAGMFGMLLLVLATFETARLERAWHHKIGWMAGTVGLCWLVSVPLALLASHFRVI